MENNKQKTVRAVARTLRGLEERIILILIALLVLSAGGYIYFIGASVVHAVVRKEVQDDLAQLHSEVAELEVVYLSQKNQATKALAHEMGFTSVADKRFAERHTTLGRADVNVDL